MKRLVLILLISLSVFQLRAADYYWVGGGGNWSDLNHWRLGSTAGAIPSIVPSASDNVFFTAGSGFGTTAATRTVTLNSNGFCNNMIWESGVPNSPIFNTASASFTLEVWGNISLSPTTTYNVQFDLRGATANTLTTGGNALGGFTLHIDKPGGGVTVTDSLVGPSGNIGLVSGAFNIAGKKLALYTFLSGNNNVRSIDFSNSDVTVGYYYNVTGTNKTVNAAGSVVNALGYIYMDNTVYNKVTNNARDAGNFSIHNCTFSTLTFTYGSYGWDARIHNGNTADTIRFMGTGSIGSNNNVNVIIGVANVSLGNNNTVDMIISAAGVNIGTGNTITRIEAGPLRGGAGGMGSGNTIDYWKHDGQFTVSGTGINTVDSLLLAPGKIITFSGTFNVNEYLELNGVTCDAFSEVSGDSVNGSLNFAPGALANMNNMTLTGLKAYGPITPLTVAGIDNGENVGFIINEPAVAGTTFYWVGGAGDWNDRTHWSTTSGGAGGACVPYLSDNVVFDANSGLASGTITTSSTTFCNNMTWSDVGNVTFSESGSYKFNLYGSLVMDNSVTMNAVVEMVGSANASVTTNGTTLGALQFIVIKTGNGVVTLADDWNNSTGGSFVHRSGGLDLSGRTVSVVYYSSNINATRSLDITNATLNFANSYDYRGTGKTIASTGSHITTTAGFAVDGLTYPLVDVGGSGGQLGIGGTTFGQLNFNNTSATAVSTLSTNNTVRRVEFKGRGSVLTGNTIDTLILAGSRNYSFSGTTTINEYLQAQSTPCSGLSEIKGTSSATLAFASGAVIDISNVYMQDMRATGPMTPIAFNGADAGGNTGWTINVSPGGSRYWVGGSGDWNDPNRWSATSGGAGGTACVPTVYDDVYFDAGSGFTAGNTVTINTGNAYAHNVNWTGTANNPVFNKSASWALEVWGDSLILNPATTLNMSFLTLKGNNATFIKGGAPAGNFDFRIDKAGGSVTLLDNYNNTGTTIAVTNGAFNAPGRTLTVDNIDNESFANATSIDISNATITTNHWEYGGLVTNHALNASNSAITATNFIATGFTYNKVNISSATNTASFSSTIIDSLVFTNTGTAATVGISGTGNNFNYVEYKGSGNIYTTGNTIDTLVFFPGKIYTLTAGTTTNITGEWYASGTPCNLTEIVSSSTTANATINKTGGAPEFDYVRLRRITATGSTPFIAYNHTDNQGNNTNWNIEPYDGVAPIAGLGPDLSLHFSEFPYTLTTEGFFGSPTSQYTWNDGSMADTLEVTDPGTYSVGVSFPDGCSINDQIVITPRAVLPISLLRFGGRSEQCQNRLDWEIDDAVNFSHFAVEQSKDGRRFIQIGTISFKEGVEEYRYADKTAGNGISWYRLRLVDLDGQYKYSQVVSVVSDCGQTGVQVYPTITSNQVNLVLPGGYEKVQVSLLSTTGQRLVPSIQGTGSLRTISLQRLPAATYVLQVVCGSEQKTFKIVKQ